MGLQRTPPPQASTSLLPRPLPPPYPTGNAPVAIESAASSSRVTLDSPQDDPIPVVAPQTSDRTDNEGNDAVMEEGSSRDLPEPMDVDLPA